MAATCGFAALALLSACGSIGSASPPGIAESTVTNSPTTTPTPTPAESAESKAVAGASSAYRQFIAATDTAYASGGVNVADLKMHASGVMLAAELNQAATFRGKRWHSVGRQVVVWIKPLTVASRTRAGRSTT
ncbi:hypothetical protein ACIBL3_16410 [Kribbella sp. NPDC050124]|uniref:hypothetical protein n=1 Tax=Kribbella sp. NPDC050124 TaxID=3364114 RepID=UPI0037A1C51D